MKILKILLTHFIIFSYTSSYACELELESNIFIISKTTNSSDLKTIIKKTNCTDTINQQVLKTICQHHGKIASEQINFYANGSESGNIHINPGNIEIYNFEKFAKKSLELDDFYVFQDTKTIDHINAYSINSIEDLQMECSNCDHPGPKTIKVSFKEQPSNEVKNIWIKTNLLIRTKALVSNSSLPPFEGNLDSKFNEKYVNSMQPETLFIDQENLKFYKLNRSLGLGQPLTRNILTPKKLVNYGDTIEVIFEKYNMKINLQVMARQSGKLGDKISLFNPKSKKMFTGKIVDFKKVMVDI